MELLDLIDIEGNKLGKTMVRGNKPENDGEYIQIVTIYLKSNNKYLIQLTSKEKGSIYAVTGGHVSSGNEVKEQALIECKEELGIDLEIDKLEYKGRIVGRFAIFFVYLYEDNDLEYKKMELQKEEVEKVYWLTVQELDDLIAKGVVRDSTCKQFNEFIR